MPPPKTQDHILRYLPPFPLNYQKPPLTPLASQITAPPRLPNQLNPTQSNSIHLPPSFNSIPSQTPTTQTGKKNNEDPLPVPFLARVHHPASTSSAQPLFEFKLI